MINKDFADRATEATESTGQPINYSVSEELKLEASGSSGSSEASGAVESTEIEKKEPFIKPGERNKSSQRSLPKIILALFIFLVMTAGAFAAFYGVKRFIPDRRKGDDSFEPPVEKIMERIEEAHRLPTYEEANEGMQRDQNITFNSSDFKPTKN